MEDMIKAFPGYAPWILGITALVWIAKHASDLAKSIPSSPGTRSLRRLRVAKEVADLATPGSPEHQLLTIRQREAAIAYAAETYAPKDFIGWILVVSGMLAGIAQCWVSRDGSMVVPLLVNTAAAASPMIALEAKGRADRARIKDYCKDNPEGQGVPELLVTMKTETRSHFPSWLLNIVDASRASGRRAASPSLQSRPGRVASENMSASSAARSPGSHSS